MRHGIMSVVCFLCVLAVAHAQEPGVDSKKAQELKWARGVAEDFLRAVVADEWAQARLLMSKELLRLEGQSGVGENDRLSQRFRNAPIHHVSAAKILKEEISPDQDEAVFRGEFTGQDGPGKKTVADLTVRVEKENGKWRVSFMIWSNVRPFVYGKAETKAKGPEAAISAVTLEAGDTVLIPVTTYKAKSCDKFKGFFTVDVKEDRIKLVADQTVPAEEKCELTIRGTEGEVVRLTVTVRPKDGKK